MMSNFNILKSFHIIGKVDVPSFLSKLSSAHSHSMSPESRLEMEAGRQRMFAPGVTVPVVMRLQVTSDQVTGGGEQGSRGWRAGEQGVESRRAGGGEEE